jgi:hypothetical protein
VIAHVADLPFEPLLENDPEPIVGESLNFHGPGQTGFNPDSTQHFFSVLDLERFIECDFVFLFHVMAGMGERIGEVAIVCHQNQAFAFHVQTAHVKNARPFRWKEVKNGSPVSFVAGSTDESFGFVESSGECGWRVEDPLSGFDDVAGLDVGGQVCNNVAVDPDFTGLDEFFDSPAGTEARGSKKAIKAHGKGGINGFCGGSDGKCGMGSG